MSLESHLPVVELTGLNEVVSPQVLHDVGSEELDQVFLVWVLPKHFLEQIGYRHVFHTRTTDFVVFAGFFRVVDNFEKGLFVCSVKLGGHVECLGEELLSPQPEVLIVPIVVLLLVAVIEVSLHGLS